VLVASDDIVVPILGTLFWSADIGGPRSEEIHRSVQLIERLTAWVTAHQFIELIEQLQWAYDIA
jgi:hypothetical protein